MSWLDGYEQVPVLGCTGPNSYVSGYPWRIVLHTTESPFGSGQGIVDFFRANPCSTPHFMIDPGTHRKVQFIPTDYSAAALRGGRNGFETNRGHAIQVEICGRANDAAGWSDDVLNFIGSWIADVVASGIPINLEHVTRSDYQGTVATENSPYRMGWNEWKAFDGVCGHIDVPFNDHYDPYHLDKQRVVDHAKAHLGHPTHEEDDDLSYSKWSPEEQWAEANSVTNLIVGEDAPGPPYEGKRPNPQYTLKSIREGQLAQQTINAAILTKLGIPFHYDQGALVLD